MPKGWGGGTRNISWGHQSWLHLRRTRIDMERLGECCGELRHKLCVENSFHMLSWFWFLLLATPGYR